MPTEESFSIPLKYIDATRTTDTTSDVMLEESIDDYWNVDGERELSGAWTGFTNFTILNEKPPYGYTWSEERLTSKKTTSRPDTLWPEMWKHISIEKPKLDNARRLRGIYFIDPEDDECQETMKNARRKLEIPMPAAAL